MCEACYLRTRLAALCKERDKLRAEIPQWISVNTMLPEPFISVLLYMPDAAPFPTVHEGYYANSSFYTSVFCEGSKVTHWMPMPEVPKDV